MIISIEPVDCMCQSSERRPDAKCEDLHATNDAIPRSAFNAHYFPIGKPVHLNEVEVDKV